jgi:hypothetical protein
MRAMAPGQQELDTNWRVVKEWSGGRGVEHELEPFARPSHDWRIVYRITVSQATPTGVVDVVVRTKDHTMVTGAFNLHGAMSGVLIVAGEEGEYYLDIKSYGPEWWVAVEQSRP